MEEKRRFPCKPVYSIQPQPQRIEEPDGTSVALDQQAPMADGGGFPIANKVEQYRDTVGFPKNFLECCFVVYSAFVVDHSELAPDASKFFDEVKVYRGFTTHLEQRWYRERHILCLLKARMSELVEAPNSFYVNASQYNASSAPVEALIKIEDRQDILKRSDDWMVNVIRWTLDTQSSLYYLPADPTATVTMELFGYTRTTHDAAAATRILETRAFTLSEGQATVSSFLQELNESIPQIPLNVGDLTEAAERNLRFHGDTQTWAERIGRWLATSDGKFRFQTHLPSQTDEDLFIRVKMSESMRAILGFENARIYTLTQQSRLVDWKAMINFLYEQFVAYRADVANFRFPLTTGLEDQILSPWEQHVKNGIVPWMERVTQIETNRALSDAHTVRNREITLTTTALVDEEMVFAEYTSANIGAVNQGNFQLPRFQHKKTLMGQIAHSGSLLVNRRPTFQLTTYLANHAHVNWEHDWFYRSNTNYVPGAGAGSLGAVVADHDAP